MARPERAQIPLWADETADELFTRAAFPGVEPNVDCAVTDKGGADYQNNSALALFGRLKAAGLPSGGYSCRKAEDERDENAVGRGVT